MANTTKHTHIQLQTYTFSHALVQTRTNTNTLKHVLTQTLTICAYSHFVQSKHKSCQVTLLYYELLQNKTGRTPLCTG